MASSFPEDQMLEEVDFPLPHFPGDNKLEEEEEEEVITEELKSIPIPSEAETSQSTSAPNSQVFTHHNSYPPPTPYEESIDDVVVPPPRIPSEEEEEEKKNKKKKKKEEKIEMKVISISNKKIKKRRRRNRKKRVKVKVKVKVKVNAIHPRTPIIANPSPPSARRESLPFPVQSSLVPTMPPTPNEENDDVASTQIKSPSKSPHRNLVLPPPPRIPLSPIPSATSQNPDEDIFSTNNKNNKNKNKNNNNKKKRNSSKNKNRSGQGSTGTGRGTGIHRIIRKDGRFSEYFDAKEVRRKQELEKKKYSEYYYYNGKTLPFRRAQLPLQENGFDCGVFLIEYLRHLVVDMLVDKIDEFPYKNKELFDKEDILGRRLDLESELTFLRDGQVTEDDPPRNYVEVGDGMEEKKVVKNKNTNKKNSGKNDEKNSKVGSEENDGIVRLKDTDASEKNIVDELEEDEDSDCVIVGSRTPKDALPVDHPLFPRRGGMVRYSEDSKFFGDDVALDSATDRNRRRREEREEREDRDFVPVDGDGEEEDEKLPKRRGTKALKRIIDDLGNYEIEKKSYPKRRPKVRTSVRVEVKNDVRPRKKRRRHGKKRRVVKRDEDEFLPGSSSETD